MIRNPFRRRVPSANLVALPSIVDTLLRSAESGIAAHTAARLNGGPS